MKKNIIKVKQAPIRLMTILISVTFLFALVMNGLANIIPINGMETGYISDKWANLFAPVGLTFSIWALIYSGLGIYVGYRLTKINHGDFVEDLHQQQQRDMWFIVSNVANGFWILAWHYELFLLSFGLMLVILISLIMINLSFGQSFIWTTLPFRIYFAWITVASVANLTTWIVSDYPTFAWLYPGTPVSEHILTMIIVLVTAVLGLIVTLRQKDVYYAGVVLWALFGIYLQHNDGVGPQIIMVSNAALFGMIITIIAIIFLKRQLFINLFKKS
jgi:hypothetical protein